MEILNVGICEDDKTEQKVLLKLLEKSEYNINTELFENGNDMVNSYYPCKYDLILMDIYMPVMNGIEAVSKIREKDKHVPIAFITTSLDHAMDGYIHHVNRYLTKPFIESDIKEVLSLAAYEKKNLPSLRIRSGYSELDIPYMQIRYIEQRGHSMVLHLTGGRDEEINYKLSDIESLLPLPPFIKCHKSYIVNLIHVNFLNKDLLLFDMSEGGSVYIRRNSLKEIEDSYKKYMFECTRSISE